MCEHPVHSKLSISFDDGQWCRLISPFAVMLSADQTQQSYLVRAPLIPSFNSVWIQGFVVREAQSFDLFHEML